MKAWMTTAAALALVAGITAANAQGTPGAGQAGQDQRPDSQAGGPSGGGGAAKTQDAPTPQSGTSTGPAMGTTGASPSGSSMSGPQSGASGANKSQEKKQDEGGK